AAVQAEPLALRNPVGHRFLDQGAAAVLGPIDDSLDLSALPVRSNSGAGVETVAAGWAGERLPHRGACPLGSEPSNPRRGGHSEVCNFFFFPLPGGPPQRRFFTAAPCAPRGSLLENTHGLRRLPGPAPGRPGEFLHPRVFGGARGAHPPLLEEPLPRTGQ